MSFRDTFTRGSGSNQNLQYDDTAAYHFYMTMLIILTIPLLYSILKSFLLPFSHIPHLKEIQKRPQFKERISKFKKENKFNYVTKWFILKVVLTIIFIFSMHRCYIVLQQTGSQVKGFDPYEILEVQSDATIEKIKKSYRKLALKFHPDRNQDDPQANAKFIMISKAYQCLTNEQAKQNCLKFGNPEGSNSFNVGIALPSFLVRKQNHVAIMGIVFLLVVIVLPVLVIYYQSQINKYDDSGMLLQNHQNIHAFLNQHYSIKDCVKTLPTCFQFQNLKSNAKKQLAYQSLMKKCTDDVRNVIIKKNYWKFINRAMLIIDARLNGQNTPVQLLQDEKIILKVIPILVRAIVMLGLERSTQQFKYIYKNQKFIGLNAILSIIWFGQLYIQGLSNQSQSFQQLGLTQDEIIKVIKKKKQKKITSIRHLLENQQDQEYFLNLIDTRRQYIKECLNYFPIVKMQVIVHTAGDKQITAIDILECIVTLKTKRKGSFCYAQNYPFLKLEGWYLIISDGNTILYLDHFNFEKQDHEIKYNRRPHQQTGNFTLNVRLVSDCYIGLDLEQNVKYQIKPARIFKEQKQDKELDEHAQSSLFTRWMSSMMPKEEQQLSDREEEEPKAKQKKSEQTQKSMTQQQKSQ